MFSLYISLWSAFVQVVGLLNTYLPLTVIVFVITYLINVKWFTVEQIYPLSLSASETGSG